MFRVTEAFNPWNVCERRFSTVSWVWQRSGAQQQQQQQHVAMALLTAGPVPVTTSQTCTGPVINDQIMIRVTKALKTYSGSWSLTLNQRCDPSTLPTKGQSILKNTTALAKNLERKLLAYVYTSKFLTRQQKDSWFRFYNWPFNNNKTFLKETSPMC